MKESKPSHETAAQNAEDRHHVENKNDQREKHRCRIAPDAEIDELRFELASNRRELAASNQAALHWNKGDEKQENDASQCGRLVHQRRFLPCKVDDFGGIDIEAPRHTEQQLDFETAEDTDHA